MNGLRSSKVISKNMSKKGQSHKKKIDKFRGKHPEGRSAFAKAKKEIRRKKKLEKAIKKGRIIN